MYNIDFKNPLLKDSFFIITSDDLEAVESRFSGFALTENRISMNCAPESLQGATGCFVNVSRENDSIRITQDDLCCFGLYIFRNGDYFAISNSIVLLIEYLAPGFSLTINEDYLALMLTSVSSGYAHEETLINEIRQIPAYSEIIIDIKSRICEINETRPIFYTVPLDSYAGFQILDSWHLKWNSVCAAMISLNCMNFDFQVDLTGGFDTRLALSALRKPDIDLSTVYFLTFNVRHSPDDVSLAKNILNILGYGYRDAANKYLELDPDLAIAASAMTKGSFMNAYSIKGNGWFRKDPIFHLNGFGGGILRDFKDFWYESVEKMADTLIWFKAASTCAEKARSYIWKCVADVQKYNTYNWTDPELLYHMTRTRNHFGKSIAEAWMFNDVCVSPLLDGKLKKINQFIDGNSDGKLLCAVILNRYLPELDGIGFNSNHFISDETKEKARNLNRKYPYKEEGANTPALLYAKRSAPEEWKEEKPASLQELLRMRYLDDATGDSIRQALGEQIYNETIKLLKKKMPITRQLLHGQAMALWVISRIRKTSAR